MVKRNGVHQVFGRYLVTLQASFIFKMKITNPRENAFPERKKKSELS